MIHIGFLSPVTGGFFFGDVLKGVVREVAAVGGRVTLVQTIDAGWAARTFAAAPSASLPAGWATLDGFVSIAWAASPEHLSALRAAGKPVVLVSSDLAIDAATVAVDNDRCVREAVTHLAGHGHTHIGFAGNLDQSDVRERYAACQAAAAENGLTFTFIPTLDQVEIGGVSAAPAVVDACRGGLTAIVAATDRIALGLMRAVLPLGLRVPEDLAVVGFDNMESSWSSEPPLATINQDFDGEGALAARLLLAELAGVDVPHVRNTLPAVFIPRDSCGCLGNAGAPDSPAAIGGAAVAEAIMEHLAIGDTTGGRRIGVGDIDLLALDALLADGLGRVPLEHTLPEDRRAFIEALEKRLTQASRTLAAEGTDIDDLVHHCLLRVVEVMAQKSAGVSMARLNLFDAALDEQFDVAAGMLGDTDHDPSDLEWMKVVPVRAACLGLWEGPRESAKLRIHGVYDPTGSLEHLRGRVYSSGDFPPLEVREFGGTGSDEIAHVVPVRGSMGDHGLLCVLGRPDDGSGHDRATYNHWSALLGVALREKHLLGEVQRSERRYAAVAQAANDGLWEWDAATEGVYLSAQCRDLLDLPVDLVPGVGTLLALLHVDDRARVTELLATAIERRDAPVELECRAVRRDGTTRWVLVRALGVAPVQGGAYGLVGSVSDIHQRKSLEDQLRRAAHYDEVTGLPNRRLFLDRLRLAIEQRRRRKDTRFAVLFLDLDGFKLINDSLGHLAGDDLLQVVAERLRTELRAVDTAARFGGDEFAILLNDPVPEDLLVVADRIQRRVCLPVVLGEHEVSITTSIGIATADSGYKDPEDVLRDADTAMYRAKETERGSACLFDPTMHQRALDRLRIRNNVAVALDNNEFVVHYQPIIDLNDTRVTEFEALVRWQHPSRGLLGPIEFLPSMEGNASIIALGQHVLDRVCAQIADWHRDGGHWVRVSVNVSHREFWAPGFLPGIREALNRHAIPPTSLSLELTETIIMTDPDDARAILDELHNLGIGLHIDDFGTGHSSLHLLRTFPFDTLKIDGSFIRELTIVEETTALVRAIITMGEALGMTVVAECVETPAQAARLAQLGCTAVQGWLYAKAMPADEASRILGTALHQLPATNHVSAARPTLRTRTGPAGGSPPHATDTTP